MKTVLITGTSKGLGKSIAELFIKNKWRVIGLSRSASKIKSKLYNHHCVDITDRNALATLFATFPDIDVLVNNTGVFDMSYFEDINSAIINNIIDTNVKGTMFVTKLCLTKMNAGSKIIFINSVAGLNELNQQAVYCASKHAIKAFAGVIAQELRYRHINVTSIHPGGINTSLWNESNPYPPGDVKDAIQPEEIADLVYYISNRSNSTVYKTVAMFPRIEWH